MAIWPNAMKHMSRPMALPRRLSSNELATAAGPSVMSRMSPTPSTMRLPSMTA